MTESKASDERASEGPEADSEIEIGSWLRSNAADVPGALNRVLHQQLKGSERLLENIDRPLAALADHCRRLASSEQLLCELVRQVDVEWGRSMEERPHFEREGFPAHPEDPYTVESVRAALSDLLRKLPTTRVRPDPVRRPSP